MLADVDAIQELTDIFVLAQARLANQCRRPRYEINVGTNENELVLHRGALFNRHSLQKVHDANKLLAQVVANLDCLATVGDVCIDWEVRVHEPHLVTELLLNTVEKILDVAADTSQCCNLLRLGKVHPGLHHMVLLVKPEFNRKMPEVPLECSKLA